MTNASWRAVASPVLLAVAAAVGATAEARTPFVVPTVVVAVIGLTTLVGGLAGQRLGGATAGLGLVGAACVVGSSGVDEQARLVTLALAGAGLFCAAELAGRAVDTRAFLESAPVTLGVAAGAAVLAIGSASLRGLVAGGGTAALALGTLAAVLLAVLVAAAVRSPTRLP